MEVAIEIVELGRRAPSVKKFQQSEILIGRAWDCDLVIADAEVDPHHIKLTFDPETEAVFIEDLQSANGVRLNGHPFKNSAQVNFGETLTVGQTSFRIHRQSDSVAPARIHSRIEQALQKLGKPATAIITAVVALFLTQYTSYISGGRLFEWDSQLQSLIATAISLVLWALLWGGITKLFKHQFRIWAHLGLAAGILILSLILGEIKGLLSFNTLSTSISELHQALNVALMVFIWVSLGLIITANTKLKTRTLIASVLVGLFLLTDFLLPRFQTQSWVGLVPLETQSLPPGFRLTPSKSQENFIQLIEENLDKSEQRGIDTREEEQEENS